jgi:hypothetical protein
MMKMMLGFLLDAREGIASHPRESVSMPAPDAVRKSRLFMVDIIHRLQIETVTQGLVYFRQHHHTAIGRQTQREEVRDVRPKYVVCKRLLECTRLEDTISVRLVDIKE